MAINIQIAKGYFRVFRNTVAKKRPLFWAVILILVTISVAYVLLQNAESKRKEDEFLKESKRIEDEESKVDRSYRDPSKRSISKVWDVSHLYPLDGQRFLYIKNHTKAGTNDSSEGKIVLVEGDVEEVLLSENNVITDAVLSPNKKILVYQKYVDNDKTYWYEEQILYYNISTRENVPLGVVDSSYSTHHDVPRFNLDSTMIYFQRLDPAEDKSHLFIHNIANGSNTVYAKDESLSNLSSDLKKVIAYDQNSSIKNFQILDISKKTILKRFNLENLLPQEATITELTWSPKDNWIVAQVGTNDSCKLFFLNLTAGDSSNISEALTSFKSVCGYGNAQVTWSENEAYLFYYNKIISVDPQKYKEPSLELQEISCGGPCLGHLKVLWNKDSTYFASNIGWRLNVYGVKDGLVKKLSDEYGAHTWAADGKTLYFVSNGEIKSYNIDTNITRTVFKMPS